MTEIIVGLGLFLAFIVIMVVAVFVGTAWYEAREWVIDDLHERLVYWFRRTK